MVLPSLSARTLICLSDFVPSEILLQICVLSGLIQPSKAKRTECKENT